MGTLPTGTRGLLPVFRTAAAVCVGAVTAAYSLSPVELVRASDMVRFNGPSWSSRILMEDESPDGKKTQREFELLVRGRDKFLLRFVRPVKEQGKLILAVGDNMYMHFPTTERSIRIPHRQKLFGQVANGDITRLLYSKDYDITPSGKEKLWGRECYSFLLKAKDRSIAYDKVRYWIAVSDLRPVKAEYYTLSGKLFKSAVFFCRHNARGKLYLYKMTIRDELTGHGKTTLYFDKIRRQSFPDRIFKRENLGKY